MVNDGSVFETWQEKFCVLTENSFYSFSKSLGSSKSKKSFTKICLLDISDIGLVTHKGRTVLTIQTPRTGKLVFKKQGMGPGVEEWYQQIRENLRACFVKKIIESPLERTKATFHGNLFPSGIKGMDIESRTC